MNPPIDPLEALFQAARQAQPNTSRAEFGFETRLLARCREEAARPHVGWLAWRLAPIFAALTLALAWWSNSTGAAPWAEEGTLLSADATALTEVVPTAPFQP